MIFSQAASGLSIAAYYRQHGISQPSFFPWRRRLSPTLVVEVKTAAQRHQTRAIELRLRAVAGC
jgi:hypothetical protein